MNRDDEDDANREPIRRRRAAFVATAVAGLALPLGAASCDPQPCLKVAGPASTTTGDTSASSTAPASPPSSAPAPSGSTAAAPAEEAYSITKSDAEKLGLPGVGFRATLTKRWSITSSSKEQYVQASGPPGGPLGFLVKPYNDGVSDKAALEVLFRQVLSSWSGQDPIEAGAATTVTLGGEKLEAQSFRTGKSLATSAWCVVKKPASPGARRGALFVFFHGANEGSAPLPCDKILAFEPLAEIARSVAFQ